MSTWSAVGYPATPVERLRRFLRLLNSYVYELREDDRVVATGRLTLDDPPQPGRTILLSGRRVMIADVTVREGEAVLVLRAP